MIIEKSNGNGELEIFSYKMAGYDGEFVMFDDVVSLVQFDTAAQQFESLAKSE
jgi:hypothetical protein